MAVLSVRGLTKRYGAAEVVQDLDLELAPGLCLGLLGPNGAGKTTTLRLLLGLIEPDAGSVQVLGLPVPLAAREARIRIGVVPQMDNLDPDFTVRENLAAYGRYFDLDATTLAARIPALLDFAGLAARADARVPTLSGGMKRRLTLARALINDPDLLFLDEPTTGLDPQARHVIWQGLRRLLGEGKTMLLTTHFMEEAERLCDRVAVLDHGRKIAEDAPRELITQLIEPTVVEIHGDAAENWAEAHGRDACKRLEQAGETWFCYTHEGTVLVDALAATPGVRFLQRPSNLEDVFLKLTGRELRD